MTVLIELKEKLKEFYGSCSGIVLPIVKFLLALAVFRGINSNLGYLKMLDSMYVVLILSLICAILPLNGMVFLAMLVIIGHCFALHMVIAGLAALVLLVVATGVVTILLTAVVPKIIEQFDHLGHALPVSTRTLIAMSDALQASGVYWLAGLLGLLVLGQRLLKNPAMRLRWDKTLLRLPVIGRVARGLNTARFSRTLSILTASSVPLLEGIQTAAAVSANRYVEQQLLLAADRVREGSSLRAALAELRLFPPMMLYMIASGEQSGELETMLEQAAVNQEREFDTQVGLALGLFEPALVVMMAGVVLFIVIAILEPMLQLNNMVGM